MKSRKFITTTIREYLIEQQNAEYKLNDNFWKWFDGSRVIDKNGNPLVVNHGSKSKFTSFVKNSSDDVSNYIASVGFWFSSSKNFGKNFANNMWYGEENEPVIYNAFLSIKNPKIYVSGGDENKMKTLKTSIDRIETMLEDFYIKWGNVLNWKENDAFEMSHTGKITSDNIEFYSNRTVKSKDAISDGVIVLNLKEDLKKLKDEYYDLNFSDSFEKFKTDIYKMDGKNAYDANFGGMGLKLKNPKVAVEKYISMLKSAGYDGIFILKTEYDKKYAGGINDQYIAFNSNQIKSVNNDGTWNTNDDNIYS